MDTHPHRLRATSRQLLIKQNYQKQSKHIWLTDTATGAVSYNQPFPVIKPISPVNAIWTFYAFAAFKYIYIKDLLSGDILTQDM